MVQVLISVDNPLQRSTLAELLAREVDLDVVDAVCRCDEATRARWPGRAGGGGSAGRQGHTGDSPQVALVQLAAEAGGDVAADVEALCRAGVHVLILAEARRHSDIARLARAHASSIGFLTTDVTAQQLVSAIRDVAMGHPVADPELVVAALTLPDSPLTHREHEVLELTAKGSPAAEIASRLRLSVGTVRNYLTRIKGKIGARTRVEAVRLAEQAGWL
jgi:two-component system, NarL family, response regulator DesR